MLIALGEERMGTNFAYAEPRRGLTATTWVGSATSGVLESSAIFSSVHTKSSEPANLPTAPMNESNLPKWCEPVLSKLGDLLNLPHNWDSYGANPVNHEVVEYVIKLLQDLMEDTLPSPSIVPTSRGGIQIEWHTSRGDLEIQIEAPYKASALFEDATRHECWEEPRVIDIGKLQQALVFLSTESPRIKQQDS